MAENEIVLNSKIIAMTFCVDTNLKCVDCGPTEYAREETLKIVQRENHEQ